MSVIDRARNGLETSLPRSRCRGRARRCTDRAVVASHRPRSPLPARVARARRGARGGPARTRERRCVHARRFVCPASRLAELPDVGRGVSAVLDSPLDGVGVEAVETAVIDDLGSLPAFAREVYVEVPLDDALEDGSTRSPRTVSVRRCAAVGRPFPTRRRWPGSCALRRARAPVQGHGRAPPRGTNRRRARVSESPRGGRVRRGGGCAGRDGCGRVRARPRTLPLGRPPGGARRARPRPARAPPLIGSCSFFEPVDELRGMGVLPL